MHTPSLQTALTCQNTVPEGDSNQPLPLKIRLSSENIPNPVRSDAGITESEAQGVDSVPTHFDAGTKDVPRLFSS